MPKLILLLRNISFFLFILSFLFVGCINPSKKSTPILEGQTDSIAIWIAQSDSKTTPVETKSLLLGKALDEASSVSNDSLKGKYFAKLSLAYLRLNDSSAFKQANKKAIQWATITKDSISLAEAHWDAGTFFRQNEVQDSAYYHFVASEKIFSSLDDDLFSGRMLYNIANVQAAVGDYTGSEITTIKAIAKLKPLNKDKRLYSCYNLLGIVANSLKEYDRALEYYNESLIYLRKDGVNTNSELSSKNNIGLVYQAMGQQQKAAKYFSEVVADDSLQFKDPSLYTTAMTNLGSVNLQRNVKKGVPDYFIKAFKIQDSMGYIAKMAITSYKLSDYFIAKGDTLTALAHLKKSEAFAIQSNATDQLLKTLRLFPKVDPKNAARYTEKYLALSDSLQNQERQIRNKFARIRFETDEFIAENELLARQKQLWTGIAGAILLLGFATFIIISQRNKNKILQFRQQQQASNEEIFNLLLAQKEKVEEGKKLEQKRVSEELHDGVLGKMLGARMMLLGLNKKTDPEAIGQRASAIAILQDVEGEVRSISHDLSHAAYQKIHNFILSIEDLLSTIQNTSKINIDFDFADDLDYDALNGAIKINLYRIIQESIQNAVKHAACKNIALNFEVDSAILRVTIADDGKGFTVKKGKKGIGMRNIASRMGKVNGTWDIDSILEKGTKVTLVIPIVATDNSTDIKIVQEDLQEF